MANNKVVLQSGEVLIDLSQDTAEDPTVLAGYTFHDKTGEQKSGTCTFTVDASGANVNPSEILEGKKAGVGSEIVTGTMPNRGGVSLELSTRDGEVVIPQGHHDGSGKVSISASEKAKLIPSNIKQGVTVLGVVGEHQGGSTVTAEAKEVTPTFAEQTVLPDGADYLSQVTVKAIPVTYTENAAGGQTVTIG